MAILVDTGHVKLLPLFLLIVFALLALWGLGQPKDGRSLVNSTGRAAPIFSLPDLENKKTIRTADIMQGMVLVNFFASWCLPCIAEHDFIKTIKKNNITLVGMAYKDKKSALEKFLSTHGNPYDHVVRDDDGRAAIEWGVTGVPETFLLNDGVIIAHVSGPLTDAIWRRDFAPLIP